MKITENTRLFLLVIVHMFENATFLVDKSATSAYNINTSISRGGFNMKTLHERIKKARIDLHLSQEFVAKYLGVNRTAIVEIESEKRKVSAEELGKFSDLFQISSDELLNGHSTEMPVQMFARKFGSLDENDQKEILNMIEFKKKLKERI